MNTYPRRALGAGFKAGLTILMRAYDYDLDYICRGPVQGFKVCYVFPVFSRTIQGRFGALYT